MGSEGGNRRNAEKRYRVIYHIASRMRRRFSVLENPTRNYEIGERQKSRRESAKVDNSGAQILKARTSRSWRSGPLLLLRVSFCLVGGHTSRQESRQSRIIVQRISSRHPPISRSPHAPLNVLTKGPRFPSPLVLQLSTLSPAVSTADTPSIQFQTVLVHG